MVTWPLGAISLRHIDSSYPGDHGLVIARSKDKLTLAKTAYASIENWYATFLQSAEGKLCVKEFDLQVPNHRAFTALKKVDFILWQTRPTS